MTPKNEALARRLAAGEPLVGTFLTSSNPVAIELAAVNGLDLAVLDAEHAALGPESIDSQVGTAYRLGFPLLVRVPSADAPMIQYVLDAGGAGVVIPRVRTVTDVERALERAFYPPTGTRGYGPGRPADFGCSATRYRAEANRVVVVVVQIETREAAVAVAQIAGVPGLSGLLIGPNDLAGALGHFGDRRHPEVMAAISRVIDTAREKGVPVGIAGVEVDEIPEWLDAGCHFVLASADRALLADGMARLARIGHREQPPAVATVQSTQPKEEE